VTDIHELAGVERVGSPELLRLALAVVQPGFEGHTAPDWLLRRLEGGLGGVALFARNIDTPEQVSALTAVVHATAPQAIVAVDEEGGDVTRIQHATGSSWPGNLALGVVDDVDLTRRVAAEIGAALDELGIDLDYAPDADVNVRASNPVIGVRSFGADARLVARHTAAWVTGIQSAGVLACAKHFPGHGDTGVDSHLDVPEIQVDDPWASPWLEPFRAAVDAGSAAIMSAHVRVPVLDPRPATLAAPVMTGLLRDHLGYTGLALSDGLEMGAITSTLGLAEGAVQALQAGIDALCIGGGLADAETVDAVVTGLVRAVVAGRLPEERLAEAAARVAAAADLRQSLRRRRATPSGETRTAAGLEAAQRALRIHEGSQRSGTRRASDSCVPLVVELVAPSNIAVGDDTPSGVATAARRRWPDLQLVRLSAGDDPVGALAAAADGPVWIVVRDAHRHPWMDGLVAALGQRRPDCVVIDIGWPGWTPPAGLTHVVTHGASWASGEAVVRQLAR
jgi:beta-N-acetylhexosaminidase